MSQADEDSRLRLYCHLVAILVQRTMGLWEAPAERK